MKSKMKSRNMKVIKSVSRRSVTQENDSVKNVGVQQTEVKTLNKEMTQEVQNL